MATRTAGPSPKAATRTYDLGDPADVEQLESDLGRPFTPGERADIDRNAARHVRVKLALVGHGRLTFVPAATKPRPRASLAQVVRIFEGLNVPVIAKRPQRGATRSREGSGARPVRRRGSRRTANPSRAGPDDDPGPEPPARICPCGCGRVLGPKHSPQARWYEDACRQRARRAARRSALPPRADFLALSAVERRALADAAGLRDNELLLRLLAAPKFDPSTLTPHLASRTEYGRVVA